VSRHLLSLAEFTPHDFSRVVDRAVAFADNPDCGRPLAGRYVGIYFRKTSTRTRTSFSVAAMRMGAGIIAYGPNDLQVCTGESIEDTAKVLSGYLDALVVRTAADPDELRCMAAAASSLAIINAMTADEHPTQAISDFAAIKRHFGTLDGLHLIYLGEGNNTAVALALAAGLTPGFHAIFLTPEGYGIPRRALDVAQARAAECGASVTECHKVPGALGPAEIVYTTRWQTTGTTKPDKFWRERFAPFQVTDTLMHRIAGSGAIFMHDLPAVRGEDCDGLVLDGPYSIAFEQARQKLFSAMAVLEWCLVE
jgi:ornithine carbamoyltransferase